MKKRILTCLAFLVMTACVLFVFAACGPTGNGGGNGGGSGSGGSGEKLPDNTELTYNIGEDGNYEVRAGAAFDSTSAVILSEYNGKPVTTIADSAFRDTRITSVTIPDGIKRIGARAFSECSELRSVTLPSSVERIDDNAFEQCGITKITLPEGIKILGPSIFAGCGITEITIPNGIETYAPDTLDELHLTKLTAPAGFVSSAVSGFTSIGNTLETLTVTGGEELSGFNNYPALSTVKITGVKTIGEYAFRDCANLRTVSIGEGTETIGKNAFTGCGALNNVSLPATLTTIGYNAFGNNGLGKLDIADIAAWCNVESESAFISTVAELSFGGKPVSGGDGDFGLVIPDGVTKIKNYAFYGRYYASITVPDSVTEIEDYAFKNAYADKITMPASAIKTFAPCTPTEVVISSGDLTDGAFNKRGGNDYYSMEKLTLLNTEEIDGNPFYDIHSLKNIIVSDSLRSVSSKNIFDYLPELEFTLDGSSKYLGSADNAHFLLVEIDGALTEYNIHADAKVICGDVGAACNSLISLNVPAGIKRLPFFGECASIESVTGAANVEEVAYRAFYRCSKLASVTLPKAETIGQEAFASTALTEIDLPKATTVGESAFINCTKLGSVSLPEVVSVGKEAFYADTKLAALDLPKATDIGASAFWNCFNIVTASLPKVKTVGASAFTSCTKLELAQNSLAEVESIGASAFKDTKIAEANMPKVVSIGASAFENTPLATVNMPKIRTIGATAFASTNLTEVTLPYEIESIDGNVFRGCALLEKIKMTENPDINTVPQKYGVYYGDDQLYERQTRTLLAYAPASTRTELVFRNGGYAIDIIGDYALYGCKNIKTVEFDGSGDIGEHAFEKCTGLETVTIGLWVDSIGASAFSDCTKLKTVKIPTNNVNDVPDLRKIGSKAFHNCTALTDIEYAKNADTASSIPWTVTFRGWVSRAEDWIDVNKSVTITQFVDGFNVDFETWTVTRTTTGETWSQQTAA